MINFVIEIFFLELNHCTLSALIYMSDTNLNYIYYRNSLFFIEISIKISHICYRNSLLSIFIKNQSFCHRNICRRNKSLNLVRIDRYVWYKFQLKISRYVIEIHWRFFDEIFINQKLEIVVACIDICVLSKFQLKIRTYVIEINHCT